jgi:sugar/nucleoside kinase (ribokinase family)
MILKPNLSEALKAAKVSTNHDLLADDSIAAQAGQFLQAGSKKTVFVTLGDRGCLIVDPNSSIHIPSPKISGPIDTVGAGDSFLAALTASLAASASPAEAATIASLAAGVTIKKLNTTGTASPDEILALFDECYSDTKQ